MKWHVRFLTADGLEANELRSFAGSPPMDLDRPVLPSLLVGAPPEDTTLPLVHPPYRTYEIFDIDRQRQYVTYKERA